MILLASQQSSHHVRGKIRPNTASLFTDSGDPDLGPWQLPVSINDQHMPGNSYVVSPQSAYSRYALEELKRLGKPWLTWPLKLLIWSLDGLLRAAKVDRLLQVNNWLLSTNLYPEDWQGQQLPELTRYLRGLFPTHALGFRSLNTAFNSELLAAMRAAGYLLVPSRQLYVFDGRAGDQAQYLRKRDVKNDLRLQAKSTWSLRAIDQPTEQQALKAIDLYQQLYLQKYCRLNPDYQPLWLIRACQAGVLKLHLLEQQGQAAGVLAWFAANPTLSSPLVGYELSAPPEQGLYRLLAIYSLQQASIQRRRLNFSSGAAHFKRLRGGEPAIEYSALYIGHLSAPRRWVWQGLAWLLNRIAVPLMVRLKL